MENNRMTEHKNQQVPWLKWGPYLSERQWGTVREDYGSDGNAWEHFPHDQAAARAYVWGEDAMAGICDDRQLLCFAAAYWNNVDPVLKERLFGLSNSQGNHGEDVKEYYFYLDNTPSHAYMKFLYKYPQAAYPYSDLVQVNSGRGTDEPEYELLDTGIFDSDRYFDLTVEYAKASAEDILIRISAINRGPDPAPLHILPHLWCRNTWSRNPGSPKPVISGVGADTIKAAVPELGQYALYWEGGESVLVTENETNHRLSPGQPDFSGYTKDGIQRRLIEGDESAVNPDLTGTKAAVHYHFTIPPGGRRVLRLRLVQGDIDAPFDDFDRIINQRIGEADLFYHTLAPESLNEDERLIMRQALSGLLWSKQYYAYDVGLWINDHDTGKPVRNTDWQHLNSHDIIVMPDKWEYPWFAAWDQAFHCIALLSVDVAFAKQQLSLFLDDRYMSRSGQLPAYEWNFNDANPPVHAWAVYFAYRFDQKARDGKGDFDFLKYAFDRLERNFDWWLRHKDSDGRDVFEGGFLGLDNIGVFDRSAELPTGGRLEQADGTAWMVFYAQNMLANALALAIHDTGYEDRALTYFDRFLDIASAMDRIGEHDDEMYDESDGFFYDVLRFPDGSATRLKVRSLVGLIPFCAVTVIEAEMLDKLPKVKARYETIAAKKSAGLKEIACPAIPGVAGRRLLAVLDDDKLQKILVRLLDENEFLSPFGIRSLSRVHAQSPFIFHWHEEQFSVGYTPGESDSRMFGGNSNWRGPVWLPVNMLIIRALLHYYAYYGDSLLVECPTGSGRRRTLYQVAQELCRRLVGLFSRNHEGKRPVYGDCLKFQNDPNWKDLILFYEFFNGETGAGHGAAHQTGWTATIATLMSIFGSVTADDIKKAGAARIAAAIAEPVSNHGRSDDIDRRSLSEKP